MKLTLSVKLGRALSQAQIDETWQAERTLAPFSLPNLLFEVKGDVVTITWDPRHIAPRSMQEIKTPFQNAIKRKFGENFEVRWLDISRSAECSMHRTEDGRAMCAIHNVFLTPLRVCGDLNPPEPGHVSEWLCPTSRTTLLEADA